MNARKSLLLCAVCTAFSFGIMEPALSQAQPYDTSAAAASEVRFQNVESELRRLTGIIEEQSNEIRRLKSELERVEGDIEVRMNDLQGAGASGSMSAQAVSGNEGGAYAGQSQEQAGTGEPDYMEEKADSPAAVMQKTQKSSSFQYEPPVATGQLGTLNQSEDGAVSSGDSATASYEYAYSFIQGRNFDRAEAEFATFIKKYPDSPLMSNATYWYGETFYVRGNFDKAARVFAEGYQKYPQGSKAASNLLKLGMSLSSMGKSNDACIAFKQLEKDYAKSSVPVLKRAKAEMERINCR